MQVFGGTITMRHRSWIRGARMLGMLMLTALVPSSPMKAQAQSQGGPAVAGPRFNLMPLPSSVQADEGSLRVDASFGVTLNEHTEPRLDRAVQRFLRQLSQQ